MVLDRQFHVSVFAALLLCGACGDDAGGDPPPGDGGSTDVGTTPDTGGTVDTGVDAPSADTGLPDTGVADTGVDAGPPDPCGNGEPDDGEECDLGLHNSDSIMSGCTTSCELTSLLAWYDATAVTGHDAALPTDGNAVGLWADLARDNDAVQADADLQPTFVMDGFGGQPSLDFGDTNHYFQAPINIDSTALEEITVVTVYQNAAGDPAIWAGLWGNDNGGWDRFLATGGTFTDEEGPSTGAGVAAAPAALAEDTPLLAIVTYRNGVTDGSTIHVNGVEAAAFTENHSNEGTMVFSIGNLMGSATPLETQAFDGHISELLLYDRALTDAERAEIETSLVSKYSIP